MANRIYLGQTGQTLRHTPLGRATSVTFTFEDLGFDPDDDHQRVIASGEPTVASWSLTTDAIAGPTQIYKNRISGTPTTDITIGDRAVLVAPSGAREFVTIATISSGSYVEVVGSLAGVYPSGSTLYGIGITADVPDAFAANEDRFLLEHTLAVTWNYTLDGVKQPPLREIVEWYRHGVSDRYVVEAAAWVIKAFPIANEVLGDTTMDAIAELMAEEVANDLRARRIDPSTFMAGDRSRALLSARILAHLGDRGWCPGQHDLAEWTDAAHKRYRDRLSSLTIGEPGLATGETNSRTDTSPGTPSRVARSFYMQM